MENMEEEYKLQEKLLGRKPWNKWVKKRGKPRRTRSRSGPRRRDSEELIMKHRRSEKGGGVSTAVKENKRERDSGQNQRKCNAREAGKGMHGSDLWDEMNWNGMKANSRKTSESQKMKSPVQIQLIFTHCGIILWQFPILSVLVRALRKRPVSRKTNTTAKAKWLCALGFPNASRAATTTPISNEQMNYEQLKNTKIIYGCRLIQNVPLESWIKTFSWNTPTANRISSNNKTNPCKLQHGMWTHVPN